MQSMALKKAPRTWYNTIRPVLQVIGVNKSVADSGVFSGYVSGEIVLITLYVDDLIISCSREDVLIDVKANLSGSFKIKDMGPLGILLASKSSTIVGKERSS